jgi:hypothetical protein
MMGFLPERDQVILNIENISALLQGRRRIILPVYVTLVSSLFTVKIRIQ